MLAFKGVSKRYGGLVAIDNLSFEISKGSIVGLLGPNGAGKTTTLKLLTGISFADEGQILIDNCEVGQNDEFKKKLGYLPEQIPIFSDLSCIEYLSYVASLKGIYGKKKRQAIDSVVGKTQLEDVLIRRSDRLSKGYRQRLALAAALLGNPEVLIMDEPMVGLDPQQVYEFRQMVMQLKGLHTVLFSSHVLNEVQNICEQVLILKKGKLVLEGSVEDLIQVTGLNQKLYVKVKRKGLEVGGLLSDVPGVQVEQLSDDSLSIRANLSLVSFEDISKAIVDMDAGLLEFSPEVPTLEEVFVHQLDS